MVLVVRALARDDSRGTSLFPPRRELVCRAAGVVEGLGGEGAVGTPICGMLSRATKGKAVNEEWWIQGAFAVCRAVNTGV